MLDISSHIRALKRPKLLVSAARHGLQNYARKTHLPRALRGPVPAKTGAVLMQLSDLEQTLNTLRKARDASYSVTRHVEVLIALIAEAERA